MIGPGTKDKLTDLLIKWIVCNVDLAHSLEYTPWLPSYKAVMSNDGTEVVVIFINLLGPDLKKRAVVVTIMEK